MPRRNQSKRTQNVHPSVEPIYSTKSKIQTEHLIKPKNKNQEIYLSYLKTKTVILGIGSAGSGKSLLALYTAIQHLNSDNSPIKKIYYFRANVGMQEELGLGFLGGSLQEKVKPLSYPVLDNLASFMPEQQAEFLLNNGRIEVLPMAMLRGRSLNNAFIIADELQSASKHMILTLLTRIGENSKLVLIGDTKQVDKVYKNQTINGLTDASERLQGLHQVGIVNFVPSDCVRHPIIPDILERYED